MILRALGALAFVLGLLVAVAYALRRWGGAIPGLSMHGGTGAARRLTVVETLALSPRTRLLLVRRDGVEHLIAVGPDGVMTVEGSIRNG